MNGLPQARRGDPAFALTPVPEPMPVPEFRAPNTLGIPVAMRPEPLPLGVTCMRTPLLLIALIPLAGCNPLAGLEGDWTQGELGRTRWQISDGLCPGLGGGCNLEVPLALGASTTLVIEGAQDVLEPDVTGALTSSSATRDEEDGDWRVSVSASTAGPGTVTFNEGAAVFDRANIEVRRATRLDCGLWTSSNAVQWDMEELEAQTTLSVPFIEEGATAPQLVCRASDAEGPLLSADAITWEVIEGDEVLALREYGFGTAPVSGARIYYASPGSGTARVRATIGDVTQELTITVECPTAGCE